MPVRRRLALGFALIPLAGCAVAVPEPTPDPASATVCAGLLADLPASVLGQQRRRVEPGGFSAAWGRPAIVLRCGVPAPPGLTAASECFEVNDVGWYREPASGGFLFTTIGRPTFVELAVPSDYAPETDALTDLAAAVTKHVPLETPCA